MVPPVVAVEHLLRDVQGNFDSRVQSIVRVAGQVNFWLTFARYLALPDYAPQAARNPSSTRFQWRGPMHTTIRAEVEREEVLEAEQY